MRPFCHILLLGALGSALLLPGCGEAPRAPSQSPSRGDAPPTRPAARVAVDSARYVFDLPALMGLTADQIKTKLGKPLKDSQESDNDQMKTLFYQRQGYKLFIDYEVRSRRILDFHFASPHPTAEYEYLLDAGHVTQHDPRYKVQPLDWGDGLYRELYIIYGPERAMDSSGNWVPVEQAQ